MYDQTPGMAYVEEDRLASELALTRAQAEAALRAWYDAGIIRGTWFGGGLSVERLSAQARQLSGAWPVDDPQERFLAGVEQLIAASTGEDRPKLEAFKSAATDLGAKVFAELYAKLLGVG